MLDKNPQTARTRCTANEDTGRCLFQHVPLFHLMVMYCTNTWFNTVTVKAWNLLVVTGRRDSIPYT